jgi:hypothetical protein
MAVNKGITHKISQAHFTLIEPEKIQQLRYQPGKKNITGIQSEQGITRHFQKAGQYNFQ